MCWGVGCVCVWGEADAGYVRSVWMQGVFRVRM